MNRSFILTLLLLFSLGCKDVDNRPELPKGLVSDAKTTAQLVADLKSAEATDRALALLELGLRPGDEHISKMMYLLEFDSAERVRVMAAAALSRKNHKPAVPFIVKELSKTRSEQLAQNLLLSLSRLQKGQKEKKHGKIIVPYLFSENSQTRLRAAEVAKHLGDSSTVFEIIDTVSKGKYNADTEKAVAMALGNIGHLAAESWLLSLLKKYKGTNNALPTVAATLESLGKVQSKKASLIIVPFLIHKEGIIRKRAEESLIRLNDKKVIPQLFQLFSAQLDVALAAGRVIASVAVDDKPSHNKVLNLLKAKSPGIQITTAAYTAGLWRFKQAAVHIEKQVVRPDIPHREFLARALGKIKSDTSLPVLRKMLKTSDRELKTGVVDALGFMKDKESLPALHSLLKNTSDRKLKIHIVSTLKAIADKTSIEVLEQTANTDPSLSLWVYPALAAINTSETRSTIEQAMYSNDLTVSRTALLAYKNYNDIRAQKHYLKLLISLKHSSDPKAIQFKKTIIRQIQRITDVYYFTLPEWENYAKEERELLSE